MVIMGTALSSTAEKSFRCISFVASSNKWARQHIAWKIKPLATMSTATMSTKFSASSLILNQSFRNPYNTGLLGAAFTRQGTSNWQLKHKSLRGLQIRSITLGSGSNLSGMEPPPYFPKFSEKGNPHEITNRDDYKQVGNGILYKNIVDGEDGKCIEKGGKIDIWYTGYDEEKNCVSDKKQAKIPSDKIPTEVLKGIAGMRSKGRRIIIVPPNLADSQHAKQGKHVIYDVTIMKIYSKNWLYRWFQGLKKKWR